jgi:hypothetical protein
LGTKAQLRKEQLADPQRVRSVADYVVNRQNDDGGYTFCQGTESNAQDTYYGLAILNLLRIPFPNAEQTKKWLYGFVPDSHYSHYYVAKALRLCGEKPHRSLKHFLLSLEITRGEFGTADVYAEVASEFQVVSMITELANMVGVETNREKTTGWLLSHQNKDGGFGAHGYSSLNSTYYAVASLFSLRHPVRSLRRTLVYVRSCEKPSGGFTVAPSAFTPYMEHVYYGVSTLELLGEQTKYPEKTAQFVLNSQNANDGFARTDLGISTFEDTFFAVTILQKTGKLLKLRTYEQRCNVPSH